MNLSGPSEEDLIQRAMETWGYHIPGDISTQVLNRWWFASQQWLSRAADNQAFVSFEKALEAAYIERGLALPPRGRSAEDLKRLLPEMYSVPNSWSAEELEKRFAENQEDLAKDPTGWDALTTEGIIKRQYVKRGMNRPGRIGERLTTSD
jgi:hypothetical protein